MSFLTWSHADSITFHMTLKTLTKRNPILAQHHCWVRLKKGINSKIETNLMQNKSKISSVCSCGSGQRFVK